MLLREIEIFRAVMVAGSTRKAAALLDISQPAVSQSIRKLEAGADLRLFERVRGRLEPTQEALALLIEVDRCFVGLDLIEHRMRSLRSNGVGRLRVAAYPAFCNGFMPRALARMPMNQRKMSISLQTLSSRDVYQQVLAGHFDFGLMADETSVVGLEHSLFTSLSGVAVMNASHALARKSVIEPADLLGARFIALNPEDASRRRFEEFLGASGASLDPLIETPYASTVCELALSGVGIGLANPIVAIDYVDRGLVVRPLSISVGFACLLVFRPGTPLSKDARTLLRCMRLQLADDLERLERVRIPTASAKRTVQTIPTRRPAR